MKSQVFESAVCRGICAAAALAALTASAKTLALYTFDEGTVGAAVTSGAPVNTASGGTAYTTTVGTFGKVGGVSFATAPAYTNDVPGRYIYSSGTAEALISDSPKAVWFTAGAPDATAAGGYILFSNLGRDIANATNFTVELFVKFAADDAKTWRSAYTFQTYNTLKLCNPALDYVGIQNSTIVNKGPDLTYSSTKRGQWRHVAVTCQRDDYKAKMYFDGVYMGQVTFTNLTDTAKSDGLFTLGSSLWGTGEAMYGGVACLRVSDRVLEPIEFMVASDEPLEKPRTEKTLGLWTFKDGAAGTPAATLANAALPASTRGA